MSSPQGLSMLRILQAALAFRKSARLVHLILHVTSKCPNGCRACFVDKNEVDLPLETIRRIAEEVPDLLWLDIGGGEPFLRDDLPELCALFAVPDLSIPTSGFDPGRVARLGDAVRRTYGGDLTIGVSLDGFRETNDALRAPGLFDRAVETVAALREIENLSVKVSTVISEANLGELPEFMDFVLGLGVDYHSLLLLRGAPADDTLRTPSVGSLRLLEDRIFAVLDRYAYVRNPVLRPLARGYHRQVWRDSLTALEAGTMRAPCLAGVGHAVVYPDGSVAPCELLPPVGEVRAGGLVGVLRAEGMGRTLEAIAREGCACTHNCNMVENLLFDWRSWPRLLARTLRA